MSRQRTIAVLLPLALVLVAGVTRFVLLDHPERIIFDEVYYVGDARDYLDQGVEDSFAVHPPVGKWIIAAGIRLFGDSAFGWRVMAAAAGTLLVLLVYLIGVRLLRWRGAAALAALLVIFDGLMFVQSRIAMLDIFLALFVLLGAWLLLVDFERSRLGETVADLRRDRDGQQLSFPVPAGGSDDDPGPLRNADDRDARSWESTDDEVEEAWGRGATGEPERLDEPPARGHPYRFLAGVAFGLAVATKWSGVLAIGAAVLVVLGWELAWRRRLTGKPFAGFGGVAASVALSLVAIPLGVYLVSYTPWFVNYPHTSEGQDACTVDEEVQDPCHVGIPGRIAGFARYQVKIWDFHADLEADHPYRAPAHTWLYLGRPVVYYWENCPPERAAGEPSENEEGELEEPEPCLVAQGNAAEIINLGNPVLWLAVGLSLIPLALGMFGGDRRAWFVAAFWAAQFVPWFVVSRPVFFFYMTPVVPFLALLVAYAVTRIDERRATRAEATGVVRSRAAASAAAITGTVVAVLAVVSFLYFYPVHAGLELDNDVVRQRWWVDSWI